MPTAIVVGGGLAGLVASRDLAAAGAAVTVMEASDRLGGKLWSTPVGDHLVDAGPDSFLVRRPEALDLIAELGLTDDLVHPVSPVGAYLWRADQLHPLPAGSWLGVPTDPDALAASGLVSDRAVSAVRSEPSRPAQPRTSDCSVGDYFRERLGDEITDRLIDPLIGGVNAGDVDHLSLQASSPQLWEIARTGGSLVDQLRQRLEAMGPGLGSARPTAVFGSIRGGLHRLIDALVADTSSVDYQLGRPITEVRGDGVRTRNGEWIAADRVIVTTPANITARLVAAASPTAAAVLGAIPYATVSQVTLAFDATQVPSELDASGVLFPRIDGGLMTACTWFSIKWDHYRRSPVDGRPQILIRCTSGRYLDDRANQLSDTELVATLSAELGRVMSWEGDPAAVRVHRWIDGFPQYLPGHLDRIATAEQALSAEAPTVQLAGMSLRGIGIPAVIGGARQAAKRALQ